MASHAKRYKNPQFKRAVYIFFQQGKPGQHFPDAMYNFRQFAERMVEQEPDASEKVQVIIADADAPAFTLFVGEKDIDLDESTKESSPYSIVYINQEPLVSRNGLPKWAIVSVDSEFNGTLKDYANRYLDMHDPMRNRPPTMPVLFVEQRWVSSFFDELLTIGREGYFALVSNKDRDTQLCFNLLNLCT